MKLNFHRLSLIALASLAVTPKSSLGMIHVGNGKGSLAVPNILIKNNTLIDLEVIAEESLAITAPGFLELDMFFSDYSDEFKGINDTVKVPVPADFTAANVAGGYTAQSASEAEIVVTLNKNKGVPVAFTDGQMRRGKDYITRRFGLAMKNAIRAALIEDLLALIPEEEDATDNFTPTDVVKTQAQFTWDFLSDQSDAFDEAKLGPDRSFIARPGYVGTLRKDSKVASAFAGGNPELVKRGYIGDEVCGFKPGKSTFLPTTEALKAALFSKQALVFAVAQQHTPTDSSVEVINLKDEELGCWIQYRRWYAPTQKLTWFAGEVLYGCKRGIPAALTRVRATAP